jgi:hypothetical protein
MFFNGLRVFLTVPVMENLGEPNAPVDRIHTIVGSRIPKSAAMDHPCIVGFGTLASSRTLSL